MAVTDLKTGTNAKVEIYPTVGSTIGAVTLPNSSWTISSDPKPVDGLSNTRDGRVRRKGLPDVTGNVEGPLDSTANPLSIIPDETYEVDLRLYEDETHYWLLTALAGPINLDTGGLEDPQTWDFDFAISRGTLTYNTVAP
jgi:hypothetical protein